MSRGRETKPRVPSSSSRKRRGATVEGNGGFEIWSDFGFLLSLRRPAMERWAFSDGNIADFVDERQINSLPDIGYRLQLHSSLVQRFSLEQELEGHQGCVNAIAWNANGSLLISGSDDARINIWSHTDRKLIHSIDTGHTANIFCTKFIPETANNIVVSGAGDAEVRLFHVSRVSGSNSEGHATEPSAVFRCHTKRVKKLAVEVGNPNVVWSASEDGTLRQHDFREGASCPPAGSSDQECRNVLLDLRSASKKSLADSPKQCLALKSCDISTTRPHQLLVGGSDAFGRLYDRRMLPPFSSCRIKHKPPPCITYFCPMHLSDRKRSSLHLTHVTFSPNGEELLMSYSGEHVYLMDVNHGDQGQVGYCASDVSKIMGLATMFNESGHSAFPNKVPSNKIHMNKASERRDKCNKLVQAAAKVLEDGSNYLYGIEACSEVLDGIGSEIDYTLKLECLCIRAGLFLKRKWKNDVHMAIRDCNEALKIDSSSFEAHIYMCDALIQLGKHKEALNFAVAAQNISPSNALESIKERIAAAEAEKLKKENEGTSKDEPHTGRLRSLSDVLFRSEAASDTSQEGPRSEREDSDYDDEMEVDFETSISGDEGPEVEARILRGSLNLRFHRRDEATRENGGLNGSYGSSSSSCQNERIVRQPDRAVDMKRRYVGHCNVGTDIKQANFLGQQGEFVASGSDDGRLFIWEKRTGRLIKVLAGDEAVVNCVQCHPFDCVVASSGIDNTIKLWTPCAPVPSIVAGGVAGPETADVLSILEGNQNKLSRNRETVLPFEFFERFRVHELAEGTFHPFECAQS